MDKLSEFKQTFNGLRAVKMFNRLNKFGKYCAVCVVLTLVGQIWAVFDPSLRPVHTSDTSGYSHSSVMDDCPMNMPNRVACVQMHD